MISHILVLVTVYNQRIIFRLSLVNKSKCLLPNKKKLVLPSNLSAATAAATTTTTAAKLPSSY